MAKIVEKKTLNVIETANSFEKYETLAIPLSLIQEKTLRTYISKERRNRNINGVFTITADLIDQVCILTRIR